MLQLHPKSKSLPGIGISAIATHQPTWRLSNAWYETLMARKFVKHTGIEARCISDVDETELADRCVRELISSVACRPADCAAVVFVSPSYVPMAVANRFWDRKRAQQEQPSRAAQVFVDRSPLKPRKTYGINGFCSGYAKAMELVLQRALPSTDLKQDEYILLVTSSRISRITDFADKQAGALFGDFATATMLARTDSVRYPVQFEVIDACYDKKPANRPFFDFAQKQEVLAPEIDGGRHYDESRVVFSLDGMGIADTAPRAMAAAAKELCEANQLKPEEFDHVVPHQAGAGIVRLTGMKLEEAGFDAPVVNGLTKETGNISSGSVPYALHAMWDQLYGNIICPVAAVGAPGKAEVSQGCIILKSTPKKRSLAA